MTDGTARNRGQAMREYSLKQSIRALRQASRRAKTCILLLSAAACILAQPASPRVSAPVDLTGYWVSVVTEDWLYRMVTPAKGDYSSVPLNAEGRKVADSWDALKDEAAGNQCKAYGAPAVMRIPGRLHI